MDAEVASVQVSSGTQVEPQIILEPDCLPDYFSAFYDYDEIESQTAMDIELKIRKKLDTLKSFIYTHRQTRRTNNTVEE